MPDANGMCTGPDDICDRCGRAHWRDDRPTCRGHRNRRGDQPLMPCMKHPGAGAFVCERHGGAAPQVRAAQENRLIERRVAADLASIGVQIPPAMHPVTVLMQQMAISCVAERWLAARVAELDVPDPKADGPLADVVGIDDEGEPILVQPIRMLYGPDHNGELAPHVLWTMWNRERERLAMLAERAMKAGVSEAMVRLAQAQGEAIVGLFVRVVDRLGLPSDVRTEALDAIHEELVKLDTQEKSARALSSG